EKRLRQCAKVSSIISPVGFGYLFPASIADIQGGQRVDFGAIDHILNAHTSPHSARGIPLGRCSGFRWIHQMGAKARAISDARNAVGRDSRPVADHPVADRFPLGPRHAQYSLCPPGHRLNDVLALGDLVAVCGYVKINPYIEHVAFPFSSLLPTRLNLTLDRK